MQPAKPQTSSSSQTSWLSPPLLGAPTASQQTSVGAVMEGPLEYRVMLTPAFAQELIAHGHAVYFQSGFAARAGFPDQLYIQAGAQQCATAEQVYQNANIMLLVNPPSTEEYKYIRREQVLFSFVPFAATAQQQQQQRELLQALAAAAATLICYSSLVSSSNPTFAPVHYAVCCTAAYLGVQQAANLLANSEGLVFGQTPGAPPTSVLVLGGGPCGARAAAVAAAAGAQVTVMDSDLALLSRLSSSSSSSSSVRTLQYSQANLEAILPSTQVVFGCAIPAAGRAPVLLSEQQQQLLPAGAAAVDLAAAAGGNFAATKPGSIESPTYSSNGRCMYTATNICCLAPKSSSLSISHAAMPFVLQLASRGWKAAVLQFVGLQQGLFVAAGCCTSAFLAAATGCTYTPVEQLLQHEIQQLPQQQTAIAQLKQQLSTFRGQQQQGASFTVEA